MSTKFVVDDHGKYIGGFGEGAPLPPDSIEVDTAPDSADQPWLFPGWGPSLSLARATEDQWREAELLIIAAQLDAIEEAESGSPPVDLLPGSRGGWLKYRGLVRNWVDSNEGYPDVNQRPQRPSSAST